LDNHPGEMVGFDWLQQQRIHGFSATPIIFKGEVLGVIVAFTRQDMPLEARP
jgi:signal transduction protein with GAF and PtsI domain